MGPSQWETTLRCNAFSHWLSPYPEWSLIEHVITMITAPGCTYIVPIQLLFAMFVKHLQLLAPPVTIRKSPERIFPYLCIWLSEVQWRDYAPVSFLQGESLYQERRSLYPDGAQIAHEITRNLVALHWRHNDHDHWVNRLFRRRSKKTSKLRVTGLCGGNSPGPVNSPHKWPVTRKMFPFDDVIMALPMLTTVFYVVAYSSSFFCCSPQCQSPRRLFPLLPLVIACRWLGAVWAPCPQCCRPRYVRLSPHLWLTER